jgi:putative membrane protein
MWIFRWFLLVVVLFFLVGFLSQNSGQIVSVRLMGWESPELPLAYMLFLAGLVGYGLCLLIALINQIRLRTQISQLRKLNRDMQTELNRLRNFALEEEHLPESGSRPGSEEILP